MNFRVFEILGKVKSLELCAYAPGVREASNIGLRVGLVGDVAAPRCAASAREKGSGRCLAEARD